MGTQDNPGGKGPYDASGPTSAQLLCAAIYTSVPGHLFCGQRSPGAWHRGIFLGIATSSRAD